jgi:phenylacetate-CoA ligase
MIYPTIAKYVVLPSLEIVGNKFFKSLNELERNQYLNGEDIAGIQRKKLRMVISYAYANVPYYHKIFRERDLKAEDIRNTTDLEKLPILTKDDIKNNVNDLLAINFPKHRRIRYSTGGSTGKPLHYYVEKPTLYYGAAARYRAFGQLGFKIGEKQAKLWGSSFDMTRYGAVLRNIIDTGKRTLILPGFALSEETMRNYVKILSRYRPKMIRGFTSSIYILAKFLKEEGVPDIDVKIVVTTGETMFEEYRKTIENVFGCDLYDGYGCRESSMVAHECLEKDGYHISSDNAILEFTKNGTHVESGEMGELLITEFNNYAMPFIRYMVEDVAVPTEERCNCGVNLPLLKNIKGRIGDFVHTAGGRIIPSEFFPHLFKDVSGIGMYQIIQKTRDRIILKIVKNETYSQSDLEYVLKNIRLFVGTEMRIDVEFVNKIPLESSGKRRIVISDVQLRFNNE